MKIHWKISLAGLGLALMGPAPLLAGEFGMGGRSRFDDAPPGQGWSGYSQDRGAAPAVEAGGYGMEPASSPWDAGPDGSERAAPEERSGNRARHSSFFSRRRSLVPEASADTAGGDARARAPARRGGGWSPGAVSPSRAHPEATPPLPEGDTGDEYKRHEMEITRLQRKLEDAERDDNPRKIKAINWMIAQENERHDKELAKAERRETRPRLHAARHEDPELPAPRGREREVQPPSASGMAEESNHAGWLFGGREERSAAPRRREERGEADSDHGHDHEHGPTPSHHAALPIEDSTVGYPPAYATRAREVPVAPRRGEEDRFERRDESPSGEQRNLPSELGFQDREW